MTIDEQRRAKDEELLALLERAKRYAALPPTQLHAELFPQLLKQVRHAFDSTRYWNRKLTPLSSRISASRRFTDLIELFPLLARSELQRNLEDMRCIPPGATPALLAESKTSGSTGQPVRVLQYRPDVEPIRQSIALLDAIWQKRDFTKPVGFLRSAREARVGTAPLEPYRVIGNKLPSVSFEPSGRSFAEILDFLADNQVGTALLNMVQARGIAREQQLYPRPNLALKEILGWTETVTTEDRELVRNSLGAKISNRYSSEEFGLLAIQCEKYEHLHATQFHNYIEILDDAGQPCPPGVTGNVVVTSLHNRAQPMFRYLLGDAAAWDEPCDSGVNLPVLSTRLTRQRDIIKLPNGRDWLPALARTSLVKKPFVFDFQIVLFQNVVVVLYMPTPKWNAKAAGEIEETVAAQFPLGIPVVLIQSPNLIWLGNWKRRTFITINESVSLDIDESGVRELVIASGYKPDAGVGVIADN